ncbi:sigma 54-interacting transcriptional regulator [Senegalia sp. (in: firmicutes)]
MLKIAIIAPKDIVNIAKEASKEFEEQIIVFEGSMEKGLKISRKLEKESFDAIIVRGGTQLLLLEAKINVPTVKIPIKSIDIFNTIKLAEDYNEKIGILAFENMLSSIENYEKISGKKFEKHVVNTENEVEMRVRQLYKLGVKVIVGGGIIKKYSEKYNMVPIVIQTGKESIKTAIKESKRIAIATINQKEKAERYKAIVEHSKNSIVSIDEEGAIIFLNSPAERLLKKKSKDILNKKIDKIIPNININQILNDNGEEIESIENIDDKKYIISKVPIKVKKEILGAVIIFQDAMKIEEMEGMLRREVVQNGHIARYNFEDILGEGKNIKEIIRIGKEYAKVESTILIEGETGTGKEIMAQSIHNLSNRKNGPFVALNCAALPESLLESELFGYEPGAFTGANKNGKKGLFELAHRGTLFLDEISEMEQLLQGRLLRVLQERQIMRIGGKKVIPIDVRIIAATNKNLYKLIKENKFREDLYYRVNILELYIPPIRDRKEDIHYFLKNFIGAFSQKFNKDKIILTNDSIEYLCDYDWPGNVREIKNFTERLVVMSKKPIMNL